MNSQSTKNFKVGVWSAYPNLDELRCGDKLVKLEPRMMRLLCYLAERPGSVVSSDELLDAVWPGIIVGPNSVYQAVAQLRRLLRDTGVNSSQVDGTEEAEYIATVPRKGYRLVAAVELTENASAVVFDSSASSNETSQSVPASIAVPKRGRWLSIVLSGVVVLGIIASLAWSWHRDKRAATLQPAIAVLPFTDLSQNKDNQPFCDGLSDELLNALANMPELRVTARASAFMFRDPATNVKDIGAQLGVTHLIAGSVRREGKHMRITAQLISVRDGFQVWSHTFDQADNNLIEIQESIAKEVVRALELKLSIASRNRLVQLPTPQASAYELYLLGRFQQLQRKPEALARAIEYHQQALVIDPKFALAYSGLADAYMASVYYSNRPLAQAAVDVEHAVAQALAIDPQLAEAYAARGVLRTEQWQLNAAIDDLKRAVALKPNYADAIVRLGAAYEYAAQPRDALAAFDQAAVLDPLSVSLHVRRCLTLQNVGQYAAASTACARAIELQPIIPNGLWARGLIALAQGKTDAAIKGYREALAQSPQRADLLAQLGRLYLDLGLLDDARQSFDASVAAGYDEPTLQLERTYFFVAGRDSNVFTTYFKSIDLQKFQDQHDAIEAALFALVAGDTAKARLLVDRALKSPDYSHDALLKDVWMTRWGRSSVLTLAQVALASGDHASADKMIGEVLDWVVRVERNGQVWYGAEYLKASALALRGDSDAAIVSLKKARDLGWRSTWWMRVDPALKTLRDRADFVTLLSQMEAANAVARKNLQAVTQ